MLSLHHWVFSGKTESTGVSLKCFFPACWPISVSLPVLVKSQPEGLLSPDGKSLFRGGTKWIVGMENSAVRKY